MVDVKGVEKADEVILVPEVVVEEAEVEVVVEARVETDIWVMSLTSQLCYASPKRTFCPSSILLRRTDDENRKVPRVYLNTLLGDS